MENSMAFTTRLFLLRLACAAAIVLCAALASRAGGPRSVAGTVFFDAPDAGQPLTWPQGLITYYTDQGSLSPILQNTDANTFVANAFAQWTSVSTAALTATNAGQLAEDVSGANVTLNGDGTISMPPDIQPTATGTPIGIVYDADGSVVDALLGDGAGDAGQCFFNAVIGGNDNYGALATYQHALIVINGQCAQQSSQLTDVEYRLVRVIGSVLGLGWSQVNPNVQTGTPSPVADDYAGFPVMHNKDSWVCAPITRCYATPYQLSADDAAAISRLYPVTAENQSGFPGKQIFSATTARIHGSVWFTDNRGNRTEPMQGVNVLARYIDPRTGQPSRKYAVSSVSGFLFTGNGGNPITGFEDASGNPLALWGATDTSLEGFFDLSGLPLPDGGSGQYQISVEAIDSHWSPQVGPYSPGPVAPSGSAEPTTVTVSAGSDTAQDILVTGSAQPLYAPSSSWTAPAALPSGADWISSLNHYGEVVYYSLPAQGNRTLSVAVTALDPSGAASLLKSQPVIGMWSASDPEGTAPPAFTPSPFNQITVGLTRLDVQVARSGNFLIGISDFRGDGRPDYRYHARVLYADSVFPARVGVGGGVVTVRGTGLAPKLNASIGVSSASQLAASTNQITLVAPAHADGVQNITITDSATGASTTMTGVLTYGAAATDTLVLIQGLNSPTPVGTQAAIPFSVRVLAAEGVTPVSGATVAFSATNSLQLSACSGTSSCNAVTDQSGYASAWMTPARSGVATITATLAPAAYSSPKSVSVMLNATQSASDIGVSAPHLLISQGASTSVALTARVLSNGVPVTNAQVNFAIEGGSGTLSATSAQTNSSGNATVTFTVSQFSSAATISACVAPGNAPCGIFSVNPVPLDQQRLVQISGAGQVTNGSTFQPIKVAVTDASSAANPVIAAPVTFQTTVLRPGGSVPFPGNGDTNPANPAMPVILQVSATNATSDASGMVSLTPSSGGFSAPVEVDVRVSAGTSAMVDDALWVLAR